MVTRAVGPLGIESTPRNPIRSPELKRMTTLRLYCSMFYVALRVRRFGGRWLASADTPDGQSLGWGWTAADALVMALEPFDGVIEELVARAPAEFFTGSRNR
jgi:hypothetical protein